MTPDGFVPFFDQRYGKTVVLLIALGASRADAEDATQEAMIAAWRQWESLREPAAWVRTTAIRKLWKASLRQPLTLPLEDSIPHPSAGEVDLVIFAEEQRQVLSVLRQLPAAQRTVAALYYDGLGPGEIAQATGKPAATVRSHLRHARATLKEVIALDQPCPTRPRP